MPGDNLQRRDIVARNRHMAGVPVVDPLAVDRSAGSERQLEQLIAIRGAPLDRGSYAPGARYATDFLLAASISSGVINGIVESRTAPEALTARLTARPDVASGRSLMM